MIIDALTVAGLMSAASFALMPLLMGREFIHVQTCDETRRKNAGPKAQPRKTRSSTPLPDCVETA